MAEKDEEKAKGKSLSSAVFLGCLFLGLAIGLLINETAVGVLVGLGAGFVLGAIVRIMYR